MLHFVFIGSNTSAYAPAAPDLRARLCQAKLLPESRGMLCMYQATVGPTHDRLLPIVPR